mmetsp:Transcript_28606/g.20663  ORF Transcript_28606/g.20663 Transcript_28606/m.20663 type:complete len:172 (+) Transcript_28606:1016-1531(+)
MVVGYSSVELDGLFSTVRNTESNLGSFICDILRTEYDADVAFLNSGTFRSNCVHPAGEIDIRMIKTILPMADKNVMLLMPGRVFHQMLENGVSGYPKYEGRFPQVSGCRFKFDPRKPPGNRIDINDVNLIDGPLEPNKKYKVAMKEFVALGKDGFDCLTKQESEIEWLIDQ